MYRVKFKATWKPYQGEDVAQVDEKRLDEFLGWPNVWQRRMARRVAMEQLPVLTKDEEEKSNWRRELAEREGPKILHANDSGTRLEFLWRYISAGGGCSSAIINKEAVTDPLYQQWFPSVFYVNHGETPRLRLAQASKFMQVGVEQRWNRLEELLAHAEDATDHNLPQMYWYALEPCVVADPARALKLAQSCRIPLITGFVARRLAEMESGMDFLINAVSEVNDPALMKVFLQAAADGLQGRVGVPAPKGWEAAYPKIEQLAAKGDGAALLDLRLLLAICFGDQRALPALRQQVLDHALPVARRQAALQSLVRGKDPQLAEMVLKLLDDADLRLEALKAMSQASSGRAK